MRNGQVAVGDAMLREADAGRSSLPQTIRRYTRPRPTARATTVHTKSSARRRSTFVDRAASPVERTCRWSWSWSLDRAAMAASHNGARALIECVPSPPCDQPGSSADRSNDRPARRCRFAARSRDHLDNHFGRAVYLAAEAARIAELIDRVARSPTFDPIRCHHGFFGAPARTAARRSLRVHHRVAQEHLTSGFECPHLGTGNNVSQRSKRKSRSALATT